MCRERKDSYGRAFIGCKCEDAHDTLLAEIRCEMSMGGLLPAVVRWMNDSDRRA